MTEVYMEITGAVATARKVGPLTAGMVGVPVMFSFSPEWQELNLLAVFRAGEEKKDNEIQEGRSVIPAQVLTQPGQMLCIGVEGRSKDGALVIPTVWAEVGRILDGAQAANDPALAPTPTQFERFMAGLEQVDEKLRESLRQAKESGAFNGTSVTHRWEGTTLEVTSASGTSRAELKGEPGHTPVKGVDYFTEEDKQEFQEAVCVTCDHSTGKCSHTLAQIQELAARGKIVTLKTSDSPEYTYYLQDSESGLFVSLDPGGEALNYYYASVNREGDVDQHKNRVPIDAVRFYATQILSEEFKARARDNIGAAAAAEAVKTVNGVSPDANGNVQVETSGGSGVEVTAKPGQLIRVKETDEKGNPTAWEAAEDMPWAEVTATEIKAGSYDNNVPFTPVLGEEYIVTYGENTYKCVAKTMTESDLTHIYIGNASIKNESLENTGEPWVYFCVMYNGSVVGGAMWTDDTVADDTIFIRQSTIHPLAPKFLPDGVPYVEQGEPVEILPETEVVAEGSDLLLPAAPSLTAGETYTVKWNSTEYQCVAIDGVEFGEPGIFVLGDVYTMTGGQAGSESTGEPFVLLVIPEAGMTLVYPLAGLAEGDPLPTVAIYDDGTTIHKLDSRCLDLDWLPVSDKFTATILLESEFNCDSSVGAAVQYYYCRPNISLLLVGGRKYKVLWDGSYYDCVCKEYSAEIDGQLITAYTLGNEVFGHGAVDSGEPFLFYHISGALTEIASSSKGTHTTSIFENDGTLNKLPEEFLPESVDGIIIRSSTADSTKKFKLTVDDSGTITATEVT